MRKDKQVNDCTPAELMECAISKLVGVKDQLAVHVPDGDDIIVEVDQLVSLLEVGTREFERISDHAKRYVDMHDPKQWSNW